MNKILTVMAITAISLALLPSLTMTAQSMDNVLAPRRQGLAVIAALEAKGDQAGLETALADALDKGLTISEAKEALSQLYAYTGFPPVPECARDAATRPEAARSGRNPRRARQGGRSAAGGL